jgi:hypothetical protein
MHLRISILATALLTACTTDGDPIDTQGDDGSESGSNATADESNSGGATMTASESDSQSSSNSATEDDGNDDAADDDNATANDDNAEDQGTSAATDATDDDAGTSMGTANDGELTDGSSDDAGSTTGAACGLEDDGCSNESPCCEGFSCQQAGQIEGTCVPCVGDGGACNNGGAAFCCDGLTCMPDAFGGASCQ